MSTDSQSPFDIASVKPMNGFGILVAVSLVKGILDDFCVQLQHAGLDTTTLDTQCREFMATRHLDTSQADPRFWESMLNGVNDFHRKITAPPASQPAANSHRSPLTKLEDTLPPYKEGRDRLIHFEDDGTIVYPEREGPWADEPLDINGYQRDPSNPFRFQPLWPNCVLRHGIAVRYPACGCIGVIMRCNNPETPTFGSRLAWEQCRDCPARKEPA